MKLWYDDEHILICLSFEHIEWYIIFDIVLLSWYVLTKTAMILHVYILIYT